MRRTHSNVNVWMMAMIAATLSATALADDAAVSPDDERLMGLVSPSRQVEISAPLDGQVVAIPVKDNQRVDADAALVRMDDALQQNQLASSKMQVELASAERDEAKAEFERQKKIADRGAGGGTELRQAELALTVAEIRVRTAKQAVTQEESRLARYTVRAPFAGRVVRIESEVGASLRIAEPVLTLMKLDELKIHLDAPMELYGKLEPGKAYRFAAGAPVDREITAKLTSSEPIIDAAARVFRVTFTIDNADESLPTGFPVRLIWPQPSAE